MISGMMMPVTSIFQSLERFFTMVGNRDLALKFLQLLCKNLLIDKVVFYE